MYKQVSNGQFCSGSPLLEKNKYFDHFFLVFFDTGSVIKCIYNVYIALTYTIFNSLLVWAARHPRLVSVRFTNNQISHIHECVVHSGSYSFTCICTWGHKFLGLHRTNIATLLRSRHRVQYFQCVKEKRDKY